MCHFSRFFAPLDVTLPFVVVCTLLTAARSDEEPKVLRNSPPMATQMAEAQDAFLTVPNSDEALAARRHLARLTEFDEPDSALVKLVKLRKRDEKFGDGLDLAILRLAARYIEREEYRPGTSLLKEIVDRYPPSSTTSRAMLMLSDIYTKQKDAKLSAQWLERCAEFELAKPSEGLMDPENHNALSTYDLATKCQEHKSYLLAFKLWRAWSPKTRCLTGAMIFETYDSRETSMMECMPHIDDHAYLVSCFLEDATTFRGDYGHAHLTRIYRDADQLLDLARIAGELERRERELAKQRNQKIEEIRTTSEFLRGALAAEMLRKNKDIDGLVRQLGEQSGGSDLKQYVADILGQCGADSVGAIEKAAWNKQPDQRWFLLRALAANPSEQAVEALVRIGISDAKFARDRFVVDRLVARGEKGMKIAREVASRVEPSQTKAADEFLRRYESWAKMFGRAEWVKTATSQTIKPPARGSLPRTLDEAINAAAK